MGCCEVVMRPRVQNTHDHRPSAIQVPSPHQPILENETKYVEPQLCESPSSATSASVQPSYSKQGMQSQPSRRCHSPVRQTRGTSALNCSRNSKSSLVWSISLTVSGRREFRNRLLAPADAGNLKVSSWQRLALHLTTQRSWANVPAPQTWNTGPLLSDSCGYIALSHPPFAPRIIVAFRGTYSIANAVIDLSTIPQEYVPYSPGDSEAGGQPGKHSDEKCRNCTVHAGFLASWSNTRPHIEPVIQRLVKRFPHYRLTLIGHSLGGAVASLASLDFYHWGWDPQVTTFGEPRVGNQALMDYFDAHFYNHMHGGECSYRRITHANDPIPLLPLKEWGYRMHAGEIYISKANLQPSVQDLENCEGDEDPRCIAGGDSSISAVAANAEAQWWGADGGMWTLPKRFRMWQLFFAHRDYFWRLGLCVPGGDPKNWFGNYPPRTSDDDEQ